MLVSDSNYSMQIVQASMHIISPNRTVLKIGKFAKNRKTLLTSTSEEVKSPPIFGGLQFSPQ
jgi:hypothetical protein